jgi:hypothetical protein
MQKNSNLSNIIKKEHEGKWIALSPAYDTVVDFSDSLIQLTQKMGEKDVVYMKALASDIHFAF